ncbi:MAG: four helix bundle protein [Gemmatimonadales bacterium]|nr:four helix bundle protein [Gemmatimonadales bacterium]
MRSHKDLVAWQAARASALAIHRHADRHWSPQRAAAFDQIRRASLSVQLNIAEGYASGVGARCRFHLRVAHGSAVETTELLEFLEDLGGAVIGMIPLSIKVQGLTYMLWKKSRR